MNKKKNISVWTNNIYCAKFFVTTSQTHGDEPRTIFLVEVTQPNCYPLFRTEKKDLLVVCTQVSKFKKKTIVLHAKMCKNNKSRNETMPKLLQQLTEFEQQYIARCITHIILIKITIPMIKTTNPKAFVFIVFQKIMLIRPPLPVQCVVQKDESISLN